jgi:hypothetical protein
MKDEGPTAFAGALGALERGARSAPSFRTLAEHLIQRSGMTNKKSDEPQANFVREAFGCQHVGAGGLRQRRSCPQTVQRGTRHSSKQNDQTLLPRRR